MPLPTLTRDQRAAASAKAVAARRVRAEILAALKHRELDLAAVLARAERDEAVAGMRVRALLEALPRFGPLRADRALSGLGIAPSRRLRGLGSGQRAALLVLAEPPLARAGKRR